MDKILEYLEDYQDLWWQICCWDLELPVGDVVGDIMDESNHFGVDFSGEQSIIYLFHTGSSEYFPGIWIGCKNCSKKIDEMPIYVIDVTSEEKTIKSVGNFKTYMKSVLNDALVSLYIQNEEIEFIEYFSDIHSIRLECDAALLDLEKFSDKFIDKGDYNLITICD